MKKAHGIAIGSISRVYPTPGKTMQRGSDKLLLMFDHLPRVKLSYITTCSTSVFSNSETTKLPINPPPPITNTFAPANCTVAPHLQSECIFRPSLHTEFLRYHPVPNLTEYRTHSSNLFAWQELPQPRRKLLHRD